MAYHNNNFRNDRNYNNKQNKPSFVINFPDELIDEILNMANTNKTTELVNATEKFVESFCTLKDNKGNNREIISTSQLRNIYDKILKIDDDDIASIQLMRPKLAYVAARQRNNEAKVIVDFLNGRIKEIENSNQTESFKMFFESIVAYHKYYSK